MLLSQKEEYGAVILELSGKIMGGPDASLLNDKLHELIDAGQKRVIADLSQVEWVNSSGLGILIGGLITMRNNGGSLKLARVTDKILNLIKITKLKSVFETFDTIEKAAESFDN